MIRIFFGLIKFFDILDSGGSLKAETGSRIQQNFKDERKSAVSQLTHTNLIDFSVYIFYFCKNGIRMA
jgi:hypothetical protein